MPTEQKRGGLQWKRHAISAGLTFLTGFSIAVLPLLNDLSVNTISQGVIVGILIAGVRGGLKVALESFIAWRNR